MYVLNKIFVAAVIMTGAVLLLPLPSLGTPKLVSGQPASPDRITLADVLARTELLRGELEAIRFEMGKPKDLRTERVASKAALHEVYFQAITLFLKADRLALELTGGTGIPPKGVPPLQIRPYHVWNLVDAAYGRILNVKQELGLTQVIAEQPKPPSTTPYDVGYAIVQANRQINLLLERRFSPSDVFQQVTVAIAYAASLLGQFPDARPMPHAPLLERGKQPDDVFLRLVECYKRLEAIAQQSHLEVLQLDTRSAKRLEIRPSDVYDMATLLVSDLAYLHAHVKNADSPARVGYPGRKFPSHVYQQASVLYAQLVELEKRVAANPDWLR